jgi:integrase
MSRRSKGVYLEWKDRSREGKQGVWIVREGSRRESTGCTKEHLTEGEKATLLAPYVARKWEPPKGIGQQVLIDEVVAAYCKDNPENEFIKHTCAPIAVWWSGKKLSDVHKANTDAYVKWRTAQYRKQHPNSKKRPKKITVATARHELKSLRAANNHYKANYDPALVVPTVSLPPKPAPRTNYWLPPSEVARRINVARQNPQQRHMCRVLLIGVRQGRRPGVTRMLRWVPSPTHGWIDLEGGVIHWAAPNEVQTNKRKPPSRIHDKLLPHLKRWRQADMALGISHVIHYQGEPVGSTRKAWRTLGGGKDGNHILRHTAATWLMQARVDLYEAAGFLGMTPETLWDVYGHHHPDFQRNAASAKRRQDHIPHKHR